jgi:hypothetical protein
MLGDDARVITVKLDEQVYGAKKRNTALAYSKDGGIKPRTGDTKRGVPRLNIVCNGDGCASQQHKKSKERKDRYENADSPTLFHLAYPPPLTRANAKRPRTCRHYAAVLAAGRVQAPIWGCGSEIFNALSC